MKLILKIFKWLAIVLLILFVAGFIAIKVASDSLPEATPSEEADQLAREMMAAVNVAAWDSTTYVKWNFAGKHTLLWDKERNYAMVEWDEYTAYIINDEISGTVFQNGTEIPDEKDYKLVKKAWRLFCNDAFWLNAVVKVFDPGTTRSLVKVNDGREGLMVTYASGGVTPGDSYVWILDENKRPVAWKMWVKIIPVKGLETSWENWMTLSTGAQIAQTHKPNFMDRGLEITDIEAGLTYQDMGFSEDPFKVLEE